MVRSFSPSVTYCPWDTFRSTTMPEIGAIKVLE